MIEWLRAHDPGRVFLDDGHVRLSYGAIAELVQNESVGLVETLRPSLNVASVVRLMAAMSNGVAAVLPPHVAVAVGWTQDCSMVVFTSGSTGEPKGVRLSTANWSAAAEASMAHLGHGRDDVWLLAMPLHHVAGIGAVLRSAFAGGGVRMLPDFDPAVFGRELRRVTVASVVPTMLSRVLDVDPGPYSGLRAVLVGGGPIPDGLLERALGAGLPVLPTYGMTETCGQVATLLPGAPLARKAHPLPGVEMRARHDGRIELRGPMLSPGYLGEPDRPDGSWFTTGDFGEIDSDGALTILGRADEMIVTGGENVHPSVVRSALLRIPGVEDAMVVGLPSEEWGQEVACLYVSSIEPRMIKAGLGDVLPGFMVPRRWRRVGSIPMTILDKPDQSAAIAILGTEPD